MTLIRLPNYTMQRAETIPVQMTESKANSITNIVKDFSNRLMGFIRKRVSNEADAEDILQDVFYQLLGNKEPVDHVASWLFTVARNKIIDRKRKKQPLRLTDFFQNENGEIMNGWRFSWMILQSGNNLFKKSFPGNIKRSTERIA